MNKKYIIGALIAVVVIVLLALNMNSKKEDSSNKDLNFDSTTSPVENKDTSDVTKKPSITNTSTSQINSTSTPTPTPTSSTPNTKVDTNTNADVNSNTNTNPTNPSIPMGIVKPDTGGLKEKLVANEWYWIKTERGLRPITPQTKIVEPKNKTDFLLTFSSNGNLSIDTDCNSMSGTYKLDGIKLTFSPLVSTQMYCEGSVESEFAESLKTGTTYYLSFDDAGDKMYIVSNETMYFVKK